MKNRISGSRGSEDAYYTIYDYDKLSNYTTVKWVPVQRRDLSTRQLLINTLINLPLDDDILTPRWFLSNISSSKTTNRIVYLRMTTPGKELNFHFHRKLNCK